MIPKQAIEKAIEGGWKNEAKYCADFDMHECRKDHCEFLVALDPAFWQALGKKLEWARFKAGFSAIPEWKDNAHKFYDLILIGGDLENFWKNLLEGKNLG